MRFRNIVIAVVLIGLVLGVAVGAGAEYVRRSSRQVVAAVDQAGQQGQGGQGQGGQKRVGP